MSKKTRITPAQEAILDRFVCERLTKDPRNRARINRFLSRKGRSLAEKLWYDAWYEDSEGLPAAYYVVKAPSGEIALYFSLKCGVLCDPHYTEKVAERYDRSKDLMDALFREDGGKEWANAYLEELRSSSGHLFLQAVDDIVSEYREASMDHKLLRKEKKNEPSDKIVRVDVAYPAIELVHFCANDLVREEWKEYGMKRSMGEVLFWRFVVPKMVEVNQLIGCEYAYLFAADISRDGTLISYYENALHFEQPTNIGGIKPSYDFVCTFMCKRLFALSEYRREHLDPELYDDEDPLGLVDYQKDFFENFNLVPGME